MNLFYRQNPVIQPAMTEGIYSIRNFRVPTLALDSYNASKKPVGYATDLTNTRISQLWKVLYNTKTGVISYINIAF